MQALEYRNSYENYAYLWVDDRHEFFRQFLLYGHVLTHEEIEAAGDEGVPLATPTLDQFKEHIDNYENIYSVVEQFQVHTVCRVLYVARHRPHFLCMVVDAWSIKYHDLQLFCLTEYFFTLECIYICICIHSLNCAWEDVLNSVDCRILCI